MKFGRSKHPARVPSVELTPMIDVVFLLIIFFMTTAQVAQLTRTEIDLPLERGDQRTTPDEAGLVINISASGEIIVASRVIGLAELEGIVRSEIRKDPQRPADQLKLLLRADRTVAALYLNRVVRLLESLGGLGGLASKLLK